MPSAKPQITTGLEAVAGGPGHRAVRRSVRRPYRGVGASERVEERRRRLLDAGLEAFGTNGVVATGVKDICRIAGVTDRYFYESFPDSTALLLAVFDRANTQLLAVVAGALLAAPPDPDAQARAAVESYVRALAADPRLPRVIFVELSAGGRDAERHMRAALRDFSRMVESAAKAFLPPDFPDDQLRLGAVSLVGAIERVMVEWHEGNLDMPVERVVEHLVQMLLAAGQIAGVRATGGAEGAGRDG